MYWDVEVTPKEEEELIRKVAEKIHEYKMETPAIMFLESIKPLAYVGGELGRAFLPPYLAAISEEVGITTEKFMMVFEKRDNIEKLEQILEKMARGEYKEPAEEPGKGEKGAGSESKEKG